METAPQLYLIAHKVRGEPAFDIAIKLQIGTEEGWLIPTSGHRAYPYWSHQLDDAVDFSLLECAGNPLILPNLDDWPDHYEQKAIDLLHADDAKDITAVKGEGKVTDLFSALGFKRPQAPTINRRL